MMQKTQKKRTLEEHILCVELLYNSIAHLNFSTSLTLVEDIYFGEKDIEDIFSFDKEVHFEKTIELVNLQYRAIEDYKNVLTSNSTKNDFKKKMTKRLFKDTNLLF